MTTMLGALVEVLGSAALYAAVFAFVAIGVYVLQRYSGDPPGRGNPDWWIVERLKRRHDEP